MLARTTCLIHPCWKQFNLEIIFQILISTIFVDFSKYETSVIESKLKVECTDFTFNGLITTNLIIFCLLNANDTGDSLVISFKYLFIKKS